MLYGGSGMSSMMYLAFSSAETEVHRLCVKFDVIKDSSRIELKWMLESIWALLWVKLTVIYSSKAGVCTVGDSDCSTC